MPAPYARLGRASALYNQVEIIPGYFDYDDAQHFALLLNVQCALGIAGDIMEIGTWKGRSAAFLSFFVNNNERLILNDVFSSPATDKYPEYPSVEMVQRAILAMNPDIAEQILFIEGNSRSTTIPASARIRFAHIDGGHSFDECYQDLVRVTPHVVEGGVIAVDDYDHPDWPEVKPAADRWTSEHPEFKVIGDLNRNVAVGRKLYLIRSIVRL